MKKQFISAAVIGRCLTQKTLMFTLGVALMATACKKDDDEDDMTPNPSTTIATVDKEFMQKASLSNQAEIQLGQLAASKASNDSVKAFGKFMVTEHTTAQNELTTLANAKSVALSTTLDSALQVKKNQLTAATGHVFDSLYVASQVEDHQKAQQEFLKELSQGSDADVKSYANKYLPHINMHYTHIQKIKDSVLSKK